MSRAPLVTAHAAGSKALTRRANRRRRTRLRWVRGRKDPVRSEGYTTTLLRALAGSWLVRREQKRERAKARARARAA